MKKINLQHLNQRLPADSNFIEFVNSAAAENIIALCKSLFPNNRAYVLYGLEKDNSPIKFTAGAIYYNGEIYFVDAFTILFSTPVFINMLGDYTSLVNFCIREVVTNATYLSGDDLPAYIERKMFPIQPGDNDTVVDALKFSNTVRLSGLDKTININDGYQTGIIQVSHNVKHLFININIVLTQQGSENVCIPLPGAIKLPNQFLGYVTIVQQFFSGSNVWDGGNAQYKLFVFNGELCLTRLAVTSLIHLNQVVEYADVISAVCTTTPSGASWRISFQHQTIAQL